VFCLIVVPLPPGKNPFAVQLNNKNNNNNNNNNTEYRALSAEYKEHTFHAAEMLLLRFNKNRKHPPLQKLFFC
jgi:hypothetical protein